MSKAAMAPDGADLEAFRMALEPWRRRINAAIWAEHAAGMAGVVVAVAATVLIIGKMAAPNWAWPSALATLAIIPASLWIAWRICVARGLFFAPGDVAEALDRLSNNDGSVSSAYERLGLASGANALSPSEVLRVARERMPRARAAYWARRSFPCAVYVAAALLVPARSPEPPTSSSLAALGVLTQPMSEKLEAAKEVLPEQKRAELEQRIEEVKKSGGGITREQWEATEEIDKRVEEAVREAQQTAAQAASALSELSSLAAPGSDTDLSLSPADLARMEKITQDLSLKADSRSLPLDAEQMARLKKSLGECKGGRCKSSALSDALKKLAKECQGKCNNPGMCNGDGQCYGRGGVNRGRGDAPYVTGDDHTPEGAVLNETQLENQFLAAEDLADLGVIKVQPKTDPGDYKAGEARNYSDTAGTQVSRTRIGPRQRDAVSKYFAK